MLLNTCLTQVEQSLQEIGGFSNLTILKPTSVKLKNNTFRATKLEKRLCNFLTQIKKVPMCKNYEHNFFTVYNSYLTTVKREKNLPYSKLGSVLKLYIQISFIPFPLFPLFPKLQNLFITVFKTKKNIGSHYFSTISTICLQWKYRLFIYLSYKEVRRK